MLWFSKKKVIKLDNDELKNNELFVHKKISKPNKKTEILVDEMHTAILIKDAYSLNLLPTGFYPLLNRDEKDIKAVELIFFSKTAKAEVKWGVPNKIDMHDCQGKSIKVGFRGGFEVQVADPRKVYMELISVDKVYNIENIQTKLRSRMCNEIKPVFAKIIDEHALNCAEISQNIEQISEFIMPAMADVFRKDYGLNLVSFVLDAIMIDDEDTQKI